ncbi:MULTISPECIES: metalloregulator ArsR/SmtB family transcription factor [unclassified Arthrobacter]|uniref:ArsR/SmtB family transcription factor n=1 Tax=unclassified Arthrobacter TaxID=235627 RepID=UPI001E3AE9F1|nr:MULTISPECIES: metalloregulator ArsR/SmtB family transcription factor [unclassified Arthrobacter]MCC9144732.1 metalloregulator ArsR/SmtB family transcription factor [Arthrobacter sp. zg-Y919]MDK1275958.1 metalloregulator ArsR/SmtB family transcription factor [Arthrobacter sp. zg.Y919]MDM7990181.1 metalloregulator ArsR/SmtB family transcription factor [Arthrobacter sp. zg-Y877]WIB02690.1 metalloregulator ArsR/SmtB family transcription factor [Arthrobacter sp. zg-Y919]
MVFDDVFAVIAEGTRREILGALRTGDKSVGTLVEELEVSQPTVSKHLKVLREAGLVSMRADGQRRYYSLETAPLEELVLWLRAFDLPSFTESAPRLASVSAGPPLATAAAVAAGTLVPGAVETRPLPVDAGVQNLGRTVGRAAERAADLFGQLPKFRRRRP